MIAKSLDELSWDTVADDGPGIYLARSLKGQVMICEISGEPGAEQVETNRGSAPITELQNKGTHFAPLQAPSEGRSILGTIQKAWREAEDAKDAAAAISTRILESIRAGELDPMRGVRLLGVPCEGEDLPVILEELGIQLPEPKPWPSFPKPEPERTPGLMMTDCSVCGYRQYATSCGVTCPNGHGGAPGVEPDEDDDPIPF